MLSRACALRRFTGHLRAKHPGVDTAAERGYEPEKCNVCKTNEAEFSCVPCCHLVACREPTCTEAITTLGECPVCAGPADAVVYRQTAAHIMALKTVIFFNEADAREESMSS